MQGFQKFPGIEQKDAQGNLVRLHTPIPFKQLKELKATRVQYQPTVTITQTLTENTSLEGLPPGDGKQIAKACRSGGDYLLWETEFVEQCQATAERNQAQQLPIP